MDRYLNVLAAVFISLGALLGYAGASGAQENPVTAIDIALEPDATMVQHAEAANARLLKVFPKGFALDARRIIHTSRSCSRTSARRTSIETALRGPGRREGRQLEAEGVQVLLIPWKGALELGSAFEEVLKF